MFLKKDTKLLVRAGFVDMRKQINGLAALVQEEYPEGAFSGNHMVVEPVGMGESRELACGVKGKHEKKR